jgi:hypothetical protein
MMSPSKILEKLAKDRGDDVEVVQGRSRYSRRVHEPLLVATVVSEPTPGLRRLIDTLNEDRGPIIWMIVELSDKPTEAFDRLKVQCRYETIHLANTHDPVNAVYNYVYMNDLSVVVYIANPEMVYALDMIKRLHKTKTVSVFNVEVATAARQRGPIAGKGCKVKGWNAVDAWEYEKFPVHEYGYAVHSYTLCKLTPPFRDPGKTPGAFLERMIDSNWDFNPVAHNKVLITLSNDS